MEKKNSLETAIKIAKQYIALNPRTLSYRIDLESSHNDKEASFYYELSDDMKAVMQEWSDLKEDDDMYGYPLGDYLIGYDYGMWVYDVEDANCEDGLDVVGSCDLTDIKKLFSFNVYIFDAKSESLDKSRRFTIILSDDEYVMLLAHHLMDAKMTVDKLMILCPELMERIHNEVTDKCSLPFLFYFDKFVDVAREIMDPYYDKLSIYETNEQEIKEFTNEFAFIPERKVFNGYISGEESTHWEMAIEEKSLVVYELRGPLFGEKNINREMRLDAIKLCKHLNLQGFQELMDYIYDEYNSNYKHNIDDSFDSIKSDLGEFVVEY